MPETVLWLHDWLQSCGLAGWPCDALAWTLTGLAVLAAAGLAYLLARLLLVRVVSFFVRRTRTQWDDALARRRAFRRLAHLLPALVLYGSAGLFGPVAGLVERLALSYMTLVVLLVLMAVANAAVDIYQTYAVARSRPIKGFVEVAKIALGFVVGVFILATLLDREPWLLLSGLGALTAVLLLVFKDSLLGLVAGVQLAVNDLVHIGDWIEMPKYGADGDVIDISLHTVKVQNWDKTITSLPSYALVSDSFKNWRSMTQAGARRIKRALNIDISSVRYLTEADLERLAHVQLIADYLREKRQEIAAFNAEQHADPSLPLNGRQLTNVGTFRAYVAAYLRRHPKIHQGLTLM
ncbi:MAG TPA: mechanosensitive ion channel, partial [Myxococcota bacterium]|nr:mechanosensitive ion channel [Myxococcota bacterium]